MKKYLFLAAVVAALSIVGCSKKDVATDANRNVVAASDGTEAKQLHVWWNCHAQRVLVLKYIKR